MGEGTSRVCYTLYQGVHHVGCWVMRVDGEGVHPCVCYTLYQGVHHVGCLMMRVDGEGVHPWVRVPHASATLCIRVYTMSGV